MKENIKTKLDKPLALHVLRDHIVIKWLLQQSADLALPDITVLPEQSILWVSDVLQVLTVQQETLFPQ